MQAAAAEDKPALAEMDVHGERKVVVVVVCTPMSTCNKWRVCYTDTVAMACSQIGVALCIDLRTMF